ncbi:hypothetical protein DESUT3_33000 [Desulfuromonas versatilis]|uniref:Antitoxin Xre/MbcA/ParS-like toxin-binding domain-containing protein n=1 Tax=Desulfuromonas versatilis TaxID=2802975 RepID=A0ABM8HV95_9BACT|nr:antitoxin Xre/MbcA/ParS toxin-binding domain-containing protein [Desulfuromonas versatilis]BCR06231.1 hypothetical protein DESUT3_33000 [Desulfuromonas versatilis]
MPLAHRQEPETIDLGSVESRRQLATLVMNLFDRWGLSTNDQLNLLGLSPTSRALLTRYRKGEPLPGSRDVLDRVGWLLAIHKALRLLYPRNEQLRYSWVSRRNQAFANLAPLEVMKKDGIIGIAKVCRYLDFQRGR